MTKGDKQLLLKDLCARLPYGCMIECSVSEDAKMDVVLFPEHITELIDGDLIVKPYLRPMSSMTEEEKAKYYETHELILGMHMIKTLKSYDWLNKNHFDYCGLIKKGLALEAPEGMYKYDKL